MSAIREAIADHTALVIHDVQEIGHHYAVTLRAWRERFMAQLPEVTSQGLNESFQRKWQYYLATCESGFATGATGTVQMVLVKDA